MTETVKAKLKEAADERIKQTFELIDTDNSGAINFAEFKAGVNVLNQLGGNVPGFGIVRGGTIEDDELKQWFEDADADGSGALELNEFAALVKVELAPKRRARIRAEKKRTAAASSGAATPGLSSGAAAEPVAPTWNANPGSVSEQIL